MSFGRFPLQPFTDQGVRRLIAAVEGRPPPLTPRSGNGRIPADDPRYHRGERSDEHLGDDAACPERDGAAPQAQSRRRT